MSETANQDLLSNEADENKTAPKQQATSTPATDPVLARLGRLQVVQSRPLRWIIVRIPFALALLSLADWVIGFAGFVRDPLRLAVLVGVSAEFLVLNNLFSKVTDTLSIIWVRGLIATPNCTSSAQNKFLKALDQLETTLNHRLSALVGAVFVIVASTLTYPVRIWLRYRRNPYSELTTRSALTVGSIYLVEFLLAYILGLMAWRSFTIARFLSKLGYHFRIRIQPKHPDSSGGLKPLGDLSLANTFVILVPVIIFSVLLALPSLPRYDWLRFWSGTFEWLTVLSVGSVYVFLQPLYHIHRQMVAERDRIQRELDGLSLRIEQTLVELRTKADELSPTEGNERLEELEFLGKVYQENSKIPVWPFDLSTVLKFVAAQAAPILSLTGLSGPLIKVISALIPVLSQP